MKLSQSQVDTMLKNGMSMEAIQREAEYRGDSLPDNRDLLQKTTSVVTKIFPGKQIGKSIGTLAGYGIAKMKGTDKYYDLSAPTPLQVVGDAAHAAVTIAGAKLPVAGTILGKMGQFGTLGSLAAGSSGVAEGKSMKEVGKQALRGGVFGLLTGLTFGVLEKGAQKAGELVVKQGERIQLKTINPFKSDLDDGFKVETIRKYNLGGSLQQTYNKTETQLGSLAKELNEKIGSSPNTINMNTVFEKTRESLQGKQLQNFASNRTIAEVLDDLNNEIVIVAGKNGLVSVPEAQALKQAAGTHGSWQYGFTDPKAKATERVYNTVYHILKEEVEKNSPAGVSEINAKISELIPVMNAVTRQIPKEARQSPIAFQEWLSLAAATFDSRALLLGIVSLGQKSGRVGDLLVKTGKGITGSVAKNAGTISRFVQTLGN